MGGVGSGAKPRKYPPEIVATALGLYEAGCTVREVQELIGKGYKAQTILERHLPERRSSARRNQRGPANPVWRERPGYQAAHLRLGDAKERTCVDCESPAREWSFTGDCRAPLTDDLGRVYCMHPQHYEPRCSACHYVYDYKGRRANGQWVSHQEVMPHV